jgi:uncharacterized protein (TIGR03067 family)
MRMIFPAALTFGLALMVVPFAPAAENDDAKKLSGTWKAASAELAGNAFPENVTKSITLVIDGEHYKVTVGDRPDEGTARLLPDKSPKAMDITGTKGPNKGRTFLAIYELKGDTLKICYDLSGKKRPEEFKTQPQTMLFLVTYQREK